MSRYVFPIGFVLVLLAPLALGVLVSGRGGDSGLTGGAGGRLVVVSPHNRDILIEFERAFRRWCRDNGHDEIDLDYRNVGGTNDIVKSLADFYSQVRKNNGGELPPQDTIDPPYDLVWGGGDYEFNVNLEGRYGVLRPIDLDPDLLAAAFPTPDLAGIDLYDNDDDGIHWVGVCLSSFGVVYSPVVYEQIGIEPPATWSDLARPELREKLVLADPGKSGSAAVAYMMVLQRALADAEEAHLAAGGAAEGEAYDAALADGWKQGMADLLLIGANARYFTDGAQKVPAEVSHANAAAGTAIDFYGRVEEELVGSDRIRYVAPVAATAVTPDPVAICYGVDGADYERAKLFVEFLLSREGQVLWNQRPGTEGGPSGRALRRAPIRRDVYEDRSLWSDDVDAFAEAGGFNQRGEWMREFSETRIIWAAAWIDAGTALDAAWAAAAGDAELTAKLRDLPVSWQDVKELRAKRKSADAAAVPALVSKERSRIARLFREHFASVERTAAAR